MGTVNVTGAGNYTATLSNPGTGVNRTGTSRIVIVDDSTYDEDGTVTVKISTSEAYNNQTRLVITQ